jgi:hypothetical protein
MLLLKPQMILDAICNEVGTHNYALFVGWSIGQMAAVASIVAERFGTDTATIGLALQEMIEQGWLTTDTQIPDSYSDQDEQHLAVTHEGWLEWTFFDDLYLDDRGFGSVQEWMTDGIKKTTQQTCVEVFAFKTKPAPTQLPRRSIHEPWRASMDEPTDSEE